MYKIYTRNFGMANRLYRKIMLIMRLTTVILIASLLQVSASTFGQRITLKQQNGSLKSALREITKQTGYGFYYDGKVIADDQKVSISVSNVEFAAALNRLLSGLNLTYQIDGKIVAIKKKDDPSLFEKLIARFADIDVRGRVLDSLSAPLQGASVRVKRTGKVVNTNANGEFYLPGIGESDVLQVSYIGYVLKEVPVGKEQMVIRLLPSTARLDEVMVMAYSNTTRRLSTGSSSKVKGTEITKQPVSNPIIAMQGRVPGLFITQNAGYAGANVSVNIRGRNSINPLPGSSSPLYIVDGVPFGSDPVEKTIGGFSAALDFSPLNTINPADIESIDVLKDADATAIYGSRGANGVILITTKKGRAGRTDLTADFSQGFGEANNLVEMLGTKEYLDIRRQAFANDNITPTAANAPDLVSWDQNAYTNFPELLIGNTSHQTNAGISLSGGSAYTQFTLGGTFRKESTVYYSSSDDQATQLRLSVQHKSTDSRFATSASVSYNMDNNKIPGYNLNLTNYGLPPNYPLYNTDGSLYFGPGYNNPLAPFNASTNMKSANLNATASLRYTILPGLDIKANGGYNLIDVKGTIISPTTASNPAFNSPSLVTMNNNYIRTYLAEPQLTYQLSAGKGKLNLIAGGTWQQTETVQPFWIIGIFTNEALVSSLSATNILGKSSGYSDFRYTSVFGRAEYNWNDKYLVSANIRRDGSSKFGTNYRFGTFGSAALGWIFSKEDFVTQNLPWLSFGKLRASYGTVGNDKITDYNYQSNYSAGSAYGPLVTLNPSRIANPYLKWEQTKKFDLALDLGFLNDKILFTAAYYRNRTTDLLGNVPLPGQAGFDSYTANFDATVQNQGAEFELNTVNIDKGKFKWISSLNLTIPQNKLVSFPGLMISTYNNQYVVGESLNLRTVFQSAGMVNGIATVADVNGDGVITSGINANGKGDYIVFGDNDPKYYGGLNNTFTYKGFQLDVFFQGISRTATRGDLNFGTYPGTGFNLPRSMANTGLKYSSNTATAAGSKYFYFTNSDSSVESATFLRLRNVSLAYTVPAAFSKKIGMSSLQLYARAQNLLTFTGYKGLDPETLSTQVPPLKMFIAGFRTTF